MEDEKILIFKERLKKQKGEFILPEATNKAQYLALVEIHWLKSLISWIKSEKSEMPRKIPNHHLFVNRKFDSNKRTGHDFSGISVELYDHLSDVFKGDPKIVRPFTKSPETGKPTFIKCPITLLINYQDHIYKKVVDHKWSVASVLSYFCSAIKVDKSVFNFYSIDNSEIIDNSLTIEEATRLYSTTFSLITSAPSAISTINDVLPRKIKKIIRGIRGNPYNDCSGLTSSVQVLVSIRPLLDLINSKSIDDQITKSQSITGLFILIARELLSEGSSPVSLEPFRQALSRKYPAMSRMRIDPGVCLNSIIEGLSDDTQSSDSQSPIFSMFSGMMHVIIECTICNSFFSTKKPFFVISMQIPEIENEYTLLSDCIAHFAASKQTDQTMRFKCPNCNISCCPFKVETLKNAAEILVIHLDRFAGSGLNKTPVIYPNEIDLSSFYSTGVGVYQLFAVIFCEERKVSCHFTAAYIDGDEAGNWTCFDDEKCCEITDEEVHKKNASVLFFQS